MIANIYQKLFLNVAPLLQKDKILVYTRNKFVLEEYTQTLPKTVLGRFELPLTQDYALIIIDPSMDLKYLSKEFLDKLLDLNLPIILPEVSHLHNNSNYYVYDSFRSIKQYYTIRKTKYCSSFLNFYIRFQENNQLQRFLDKDQTTSFSDMLMDIASSFYDVRARLVYPFDEGGHSGCFILGESHWCWTWHTWPEHGRLDMSINSCTNKNPIPLIKTAMAEMFKLNPQQIYSDYKEVDVYFH